MTARTSFVSYSPVCFAAALAAFSQGCQTAPSPGPEAEPVSPMQPVRKLEGAPARVLDMRFAPDGASVLVLERRPAKDDSPGARDTFAISRRPIEAGAAKDLYTSQGLEPSFTLLGDGVVVRQRPRLPASEDEDRDSNRSEDLREALDNTALFRAGDGGAPVQVSPEGRRCLYVVGAPNAQWVAYSVAPPRPSNGREISGSEEENNAETHLLGAKPGEEITLAVKGLVRGISPDGSRVLVHRTPADKPNEVPVLVRGTVSWLTGVPAAPLDTPKTLVMVTVKEQTVRELPASLKVDGADIDTAELSVGFSGDGLIFWSAKGELYGSALDGSKATRLAGPFEGAIGTLPDGGALPAKVRRVIGPKGSVFELREAADGVLLSSLRRGMPGAAEPVARFEGPLAALGVTFDASEKRIAVAALSDTSRNGAFEREHDDTELFVTDDASTLRSFGRVPALLLADELRPKIAAAAGIPESAVGIVPENGSIRATVELPWIAGEKAAALFDRTLGAARAIVPVIPQKDISIRLAVESLELKVERLKDGGGGYIALAGSGVWVADATALPLKLHNPVRTMMYSSSHEKVSGTLENAGSEATGPIEAFIVLIDGAGATRKRREVVQRLGKIAPGKSATYALVVANDPSGRSPNVTFRAEGKRVEVFNEYVYDHSVDWLDAVLDVRAAHGVWSTHNFTAWRDWVVHLTAEQAALPDGAREELFRTIAKRLQDHRDKFHRGYRNSIRFEAPGGGGWRLDPTENIGRYEAGEEEQKLWR